MTNQDLLRIVKTQIANELSCAVEDFAGAENRVTLARWYPDCRRYIKEKPLCHMACFGKAAVVTADERCYAWLTAFVKKHDGINCFDCRQLMAINDELRKNGARLSFLSEYYLPDVMTARSRADGLNVKILEEQEIVSLYSDPRFHMALGYSTSERRRDVLAAVAYDGDEIMGVAAASNDTDVMYQIGIDVVPSYRNRGIAATLTGMLTDEIIRRGKVPFYGTWWSNIASRKVALRSGYTPAWVEIEACKIDCGSTPIII